MMLLRHNVPLLRPFLVNLEEIIEDVLPLTLSLFDTAAGRLRKTLGKKDSYSHVVEEVLWMTEKELACFDPVLKDFRNLLGPRVGGYGGSLDGLAIELYRPAF